MHKLGLVVLALVSVADLLTPVLTDGEHPPMEIAIGAAVVGLVSLVLIGFAWQGKACVSPAPVPPAPPPRHPPVLDTTTASPGRRSRTGDHGPSGPEALRTAALGVTHRQHRPARRRAAQEGTT